MMYRENPFHNFEHASHVTMSVVKLLSRIVAHSDIAVGGDTGAMTLASSLHDHTYGITSDPLTQFACIFSALIHDVDHVGVPNTQLIKENATTAALYKGKSVAEQNSVDIAWTLLMNERYENIRRTIYNTEAEYKRFQQLIVNSVMATDIMDKDLEGIRNGIWERAFNEAPDNNLVEAVNRKAIIVIEHLIQASDVAHIMQTLCSSGIFTASGTRGSFQSCTRHTSKDVQRKTHRNSGTRMRLDSSTVTLFRSRKSSRTAEFSAYRVTNT